MNFKKEIGEILAEYNVDFDGNVETPFGNLNITYDEDGTLYSVFMRFTEEFDINIFFKYFASHEVINRYSKKWNLHDADAEFVIQEFEERLHNLKVIFEREGKVI